MGRNENNQGRMRKSDGEEELRSHYYDTTE